MAPTRSNQSDLVPSIIFFKGFSCISFLVGFFFYWLPPRQNYGRPWMGFVRVFCFYNENVINFFGFVLVLTAVIPCPHVIAVSMPLHTRPAQDMRAQKPFPKCNNSELMQWSVVVP